MPTKVVEPIGTSRYGTGPLDVLFACGLILDTVTRGRREAKLMAYLALAYFALRAPGEERRRS